MKPPLNNFLRIDSSKPILDHLKKSTLIINRGKNVSMSADDELKSEFFISYFWRNRKKTIDSHSILSTKIDSKGVTTRKNRFVKKIGNSLLLLVI